MLRKISELSKQIRGVSYKPSDIHANLNDSSITLLRANNISDGIINFDDVVYVDKSKVSDSQILRKGDILICASSGSKNLVGKAASVDFDGNYTFGAFLKVVRPNSEYSSYLGQFFQSPKYRKAISSLALGANINNIRNEHIDSLTVPELDSKKREGIVARLSLISDVIRKRKFQMQALDDLVKARFVEMFGDKNTANSVLIGEAVELINGRAFKPTDWTVSGLPIIRIQNLNDPKAPYNHFDGSYDKKNYVKKGELLFSWSGTPGTSFGAFIWDREPGLLNQHIFRVLPKKDYDLKFLRFALNAQLDEIISKAHGGVGLQHITKSELEKISIPYPSREQQAVFSNFVARVDKSKFNALKPHHKPYEFMQFMV